MAEPYKLHTDPYEDDADAPTKVGALARSGMRPIQTRLRTDGPMPVIFYDEDERLDPSGLIGSGRQEHTVVMPISPTIRLAVPAWPAPPGVLRLVPAPAPAPAPLANASASLAKASGRRSILAVVMGLALGLVSALAIGVALLFFFE